MLNKSLQQPDVIQQPLLNDENFLRNLVSTVCQQLLEAEISAVLQALPYERTESTESTESREGYRNGYKPRQLKTRVGKLSTLFRSPSGPRRHIPDSAFRKIPEV
jgi:transposase-like protein